MKRLIVFLLIFLTLTAEAQEAKRVQNLPELLYSLDSIELNRDKLELIDKNWVRIYSFENNDTLTSILTNIFLSESENHGTESKRKAITSLIGWYAFKKDIHQMMSFADSIFSNDPFLNLTDSVMIYHTLAMGYKQLGIFEKTIELLLLRDELINRASPTEKEYFSKQYLQHLDILYYELGLYNEALDIAKRNEAIYKEAGRINEFYSMYNNMGLMWLRLNNPDSALFYFNKAITVLTNMPVKRDTAFRYFVEGNMGTAFLQKKDFDTAFVLLSRDLDISKKLRNYYSLSNSYLSLSDYYMQTNKPRLSLSALDSALKAMNHIKYYGPLNRYYLLRSKTYNELNSNDSASYYAFKYIYYNDSIQKAEKQKRVVNLLVTLDMRNKEYLIAQQKSELELEKIRAGQERTIRNFILASLFISLIFLFIIYRSHKKQQQTNLLLEKQNRQISEQAGQLRSTNDKLRELDLFKQNVSDMIVHDLKNPLNTILSLAESTDYYDRKQVNQAGHIMLNLVMNILDVNKFEDSKLTPHISPQNALEMINQAISRVDTLAKNKDIDIQVKVPGDFFVMADFNLVTRVFVNLLTNAIKHSGPHDQIEISALKQDDNKVKFLVSDYGPGIPEKDREKIFEKFYSGEKRESGRMESTGLGLAFCKLVMEAHMGTIGIDPDVKKGATFWIVLDESDLAVPIVANGMDSTPEKENWKFNIEEIKKLEPVIEKLSELEYYEATSIYTVLAGLEASGSLAIEKWKAQMEQAIRLMNKELYHRLLNIFNPSGEEISGEYFKQG